MSTLISGKNQLPERDVDGSKLVYSVRELEDQMGLPLKEGEKVKAGESNYLVSYNEDKTQVTNTYEVPKTNIVAKKVWVGGQETVRPTVYFKLYRTPEGGVIEEVSGVEKKEVPKIDGTVEWTDLPETDEHGVKYTYSVMEVDEEGNLIVDPIDGYTPKYENGKLIEYKVKEVAVKEYTSTVTTDKDGKYTVTNEYTPEKIAVSGQKTWIDNNDQDRIRPASITVKLFANGKDTGKTAIASEASGWTYEFTDLDRNKDGKEITYTIDEVELPKGYTKVVDGYTITNTYTPERPGPKPKLPNTGEKASNTAVVAGLALMAVTGGLYFVSRKNK